MFDTLAEFQCIHFDSNYFENNKVDQRQHRRYAIWIRNVFFMCLCFFLSMLFFLGKRETFAKKKSQCWKELCLVSKGKIDMRKWFVAKCFNSNHSNNLNNFVFLRIRQIQFGTNWMSLNSWCIQCWRPVKFLLGFYDRFYKFNKKSQSNGWNDARRKTTTTKSLRLIYALYRIQL